jgi:phospholipase D1/2
MVDRIVRAYQSREEFQIVVVMPAVPAFAGDLKSEGALGTRAIMEFQYASINRDGSSIIETLRSSGVQDPHRYINFYNLRNYDRINTSAIMGMVERESGVRYEEARRGYDERYEGSTHEGGRAEYGGGSRDDSGSQYRRYQEAASRMSDETWNSISACYMQNGPDLRSLPWTGSPEEELDAFVSEQLYVHSKVLIADDQLVICGSANLNDRSQLGNHDSEIAVIIEDPTPVSSTMGGRPYTASAFATSLRRQLYRKHLGLVPHQRPDAPDRNWTPVTHTAVNDYDWNSPADRLVQDPMSREFIDLWRGTARRNTEIFSRAFHPVPNDKVRTWEEYDAFFSKHFVIPGEPAEQAAEGYKQGKVDYGHVVREEFPGGVGELKDWLSGVRGTLVEMPLQFLIDVHDLAEDGLALNSLTDELYT